MLPVLLIALAATPSPAPLPLLTPAPVRIVPAAGATPLPQPTFVPVSPNAQPVLLPADQASPLPFPAYGTPSPVSRGSTVAPDVPQVVTLEQAILIAYAKSPLLAQARAQVEIASAPVQAAQSALLPNVSGSASSTRSHREAGGTNGGGTTGGGTATGTVIGGGNASNTATTNALNLNLRQLIFDGGRVSAQIRQARANQSASIATYQRQLQTVAYNVSTAYYNALSAQRQTRVALQTVLLDQLQENLVVAQVRAGTAARADLATAQLPTAQARVAVTRSQAAELTALATFANTLGLDADVNVQPKDDVPALSATSGTVAVSPSFPTPTYQQALTRALALRPDLSSTQFAIQAAQANLRAARLGLFPTLSASAGYGTTSTDSNGGTFRNASSAGLALAVPIFDQGLTRAQVAQARGQLDLVNAQYVAATQGVQLNVKQALVNLVSAYAQVEQTNAELAKAQEVLRSTQAQYRAGVTTLPLLLNAQVGITQALTDEVTAIYNVRQAEQNLLYAEGANAAG